MDAIKFAIKQIPAENFVVIQFVKITFSLLSKFDAWTTWLTGPVLKGVLFAWSSSLPYNSAATEGFNWRLLQILAKLKRHQLVWTKNYTQDMKANATTPSRNKWMSNAKIVSCCAFIGKTRNIKSYRNFVLKLALCIFWLKNVTLLLAMILMLVVASRIWLQSVWKQQSGDNGWGGVVRMMLPLLFIGWWWWLATKRCFST